jgi:predicted ATP-grasp superfamily ATP-dependent carboligase
MKTETAPLPPVIILGGDPNALSIARNLGRRGIPVYLVNEPDAPVRYSRYCRFLPVPWLGSNETSWTAYLLGPDVESLRGAVLLAASDEALEIIAHNCARLGERFLLDESNPDAQKCMLNKLSTYEAARNAQVPMPRFWVTAGGASLDELAPDLVYPLLVKPLFSHRFGFKFGGKKFFVAHDFDGLRQGLDTARGAGVEVILMEMIPGPDDLLCSYYTYLDEHGAPQFDFTKRIIRRFPVGMGNGCYHITDWNPEVRDVALRLFRHVGLRGLANAEFKRDPRDGQLKLIECNARFTAADCLVTRSGLDLASFVYNRLVGLPPPRTENYRTGLRLWYPTQDFKAFLELRKTGQLTLAGWLRSIAHRQTLPYFQWRDPLPSVVRFLRFVKADVLYRRVNKVAAWVRSWFRGPACDRSGPSLDVSAYPLQGRE